ANAVAKVLQFRLEAASAAYWVNLDLENIEELFSLAAASPGRVTNEIQLAIAATLDYARQMTGALRGRVEVTNSQRLFQEATNANPWPVWAKKVEGTGGMGRFGSFEIGTYAFYAAHLLGM